MNNSFAGGAARLLLRCGSLSVIVGLNLRDHGAKSPCRWGSCSGIYTFDVCCLQHPKLPLPCPGMLRQSGQFADWCNPDCSTAEFPYNPAMEEVIKCQLKRFSRKQYILFAFSNLNFLQIRSILNANGHFMEIIYNYNTNTIIIVRLPYQIISCIFCVN